LAQGGTGLSTTPQIALVGCGYWGKNLCRNFHALGALSSVVDATESGQITARTIAPDAQITDNLDDVLRNDQIQGVALVTPAETHVDLAIQAMQAGKDVFVEKPMALTLDDAKKMKKVAEGTGRILMVGHLLEYHPAILKLREMITSGELG
jgi:predicted dehydrogenase